MRNINLILTHMESFNQTNGLGIVDDLSKGVRYQSEKEGWKGVSLSKTPWRQEESFRSPN